MLRSVFRDRQKQDVLIAAGFALMMLGILAVCLFLPGILYAKKRETIPNVLLLPLGLSFVYMVYRGAGRLLSGMNRTGRKRVFLLCSLGALAVQLFMVYQYYFYTDWDVETIVQCAMAAVTGEDISRHSTYFSMYPNNLVLVTLLGWIVRLAYALGLSQHAYFAMIAFQGVICWAAGVLLCMLVDHLLHDDGLTAMAWVLYQLLIGCSPWISIPYSDIVALFFPTAILAVFFLLPKTGMKGVLRMFLLAFLSYFGYRIKPQILIVLIAIVLYQAAAMIFGRTLKILRGALKPGHVCALAAGLCSAVLLANTMAAQVDVEIDEELAFGIPHFLMMGMNTEEFGAYYQRDVSFSWRCATRAERTQKNLEVFGERVSEMGAVGLAKQLIRKTLTNFNDGTFCWAGEGVFYREILEEKLPVISPLLRSIYYSHEGRLYPVWANLAQMIWMGVLALSFCAWMHRGDERLSVIMLSVIGFTLFETLFEARARYLLCFAPLYIMLCTMGLHALKTRLEAFRRSRM